MKKHIVFPFLLMACLYLEAQVNLNLSLVTYYPFNGNANDESGNNINGVVNNSTLTTDKNGVGNIFVTGVLEASDLSQTRFILQDGPASKIAFGKKGDSNGDLYKGKMDDIRIYHGVLNQEEIDVLSEYSTVASFSVPDTICLNTPVTITNTSTNASTYLWNFCTADINSIPEAANLGNPNNLLSIPGFLEIVYDNGKYYGFSANYTNNGSSLVRLDFGNSLQNTPIATSLGNFNGTFPLRAQGIQVIKSNGKWYNYSSRRQSKLRRYM